MFTYMFWGKVLPERAPLDMNYNAKFTALDLGFKGEAFVNIILNQVLVTLKLDKEENIFILKRIVSSLLDKEMAKLAFIRGFNYTAIIDRCVKEDLTEDWVFGIDYPIEGGIHCLMEINGMMNWLREVSVGVEGLLIDRCLNDFKSALTHIEDAPFYCFRAIESLRNHCSDLNNVSDKTRAKQWEVFREVALVSSEEINFFTKWSRDIRHGRVAYMSGDEEVAVVNKARHIIFSYLKRIGGVVGR
jgi:hypothetical protein